MSGTGSFAGPLRPRLHAGSRGRQSARAGARPRRVELSGVESLTAAERRVAELAVEGRRNREIAEALFVTIKTVEGHVAPIYAKLGITGRSRFARHPAFGLILASS